MRNSTCSIAKTLFFVIEAALLIAVIVCGWVYLSFYPASQTASECNIAKARLEQEKQYESYLTYSGFITEMEDFGIFETDEVIMVDGEEKKVLDLGYFQTDTVNLGCEYMSQAKIRVNDRWFYTDYATYVHYGDIDNIELSKGDYVTFAYSTKESDNEEFKGCDYVVAVKRNVENRTFIIGLFAYCFVLPIPCLLFYIFSFILVGQLSKKRAGEKVDGGDLAFPIVMIAISVVWGTLGLILAVRYLQMANAAAQHIHVHAPIIYLYPEEATEVNVQLDLDGELTTSYPEYPTDGWTVTASPDGTLTDANGRDYDYLYWQGDLNMNSDFSQGFCVKREDSAEFLETALGELGLNDSESNMFIMYWLPYLQANEYNVISFQTENYEDVSGLKIYPEPDNVIRVNMAFYGSDVSVEIEPQNLSSMNDVSRDGFTVVEWGGEPVTEP